MFKNSCVVLSAASSIYLLVLFITYQLVKYTSSYEKYGVYGVY